MIKDILFQFLSDIKRALRSLRADIVMRFINPSGQINKLSGRFINSSGQFINASGQINKLSGRITKSSGRFINSSGQFINSSGQITKSHHDVRSGAPYRSRLDVRGGGTVLFFHFDKLSEEWPALGRLHGLLFSPFNSLSALSTISQYG